MATHCRYPYVPGLVTENCVMIQRFAALSYCTIGSPSLLTAQPLGIAGRVLQTGPQRVPRFGKAGHD